MKYNWVYLCSQPDFLRLTLKNLPLVIDGLCHFIVVLDERHEHLEDECMSILESTPGPGSRSIAHGSDIAAEFHPGGAFGAYLNNTANPTGFHKNALGIKMLLPLAFQDPLLYTDDDVVCLQDPRPFDVGRFCSYNRFHRFGWDLASWAELEAYDEIFGSNLDPAEFNQNILDAGIWFTGAEFDRDDWALKLRTWWAHPFIRALAEKSTQQRFRVMDQRFLTMFFMKHGCKRFSSTSKYTRELVFRFGKPPMSRKLIEGCTFVHYGTDKLDYWNWLRENLT